MFWCCCGEPAPIATGVNIQLMAMQAILVNGVFVNWSNSPIAVAGNPLPSTAVTPYPGFFPINSILIGHDIVPGFDTFHSFYGAFCYQAVTVPQGQSIASAVLNLRQNPSQAAYPLSTKVIVHIAQTPASGTQFNTSSQQDFPYLIGQEPSENFATSFITRHGAFFSPIELTLTGSGVDADVTTQVQQVFNHPSWDNTKAIFYFIRTDLTASRWITNASQPPGRDDNVWLGGPESGLGSRNRIAITL